MEQSGVECKNVQFCRVKCKKVEQNWAKLMSMWKRKEVQKLTNVHVEVVKNIRTVVVKTSNTKT